MNTARTTPELQYLGGIYDNTKSLPFGADYLLQSNLDANGNYQTIVYKKGGANGDIVKTITLTFDGNSNVVTYLEV